MKSKLPYQETEAFKEVVNEYKKRRTSGLQKEKKVDKRLLKAASNKADATTNVTELYPRKLKRTTGTISKMTSSLINALGKKVRTILILIY